MYVSSPLYSTRGFELPSAYEVKGSGFLTQMECTQAAVFLNSEQNGDRVEGVYQQLSDQSKDVLSKLKDGGQVEKDTWKGLCKELLDLGQITESEYACSNLDYRLIPLGCHDASGNFVKYSNTADMVRASRSLAQWPGDPLNICWIAGLSCSANGAYSWPQSTIRTALQNIVTSHRSAIRRPPVTRLRNSFTAWRHSADPLYR